MDIMSAFPSNYVKASDLQGREVEVGISHVTVEEIGGDRLPVLYFQGKEKGMVLNKTNAMNISLVHGQNTDNWAGRRIVLFPTTTDFNGRTVDCIRAKGPQHTGQNHQAPLGASAAPLAQPAPAPQPAHNSPPTNGGGTPFDLNDSIPF